jgi:hypothetical protein
VQKHLMLVFTRPVEGREEEFNHWYDTRHLADIASLPGVVSGQRYLFDEASKNSLSQAPELGYLAIYEVAEGHLEEAKAALAETSAERRAAAAAGDGRPVRVPGTPAIAPGNITYWFTAIGEPVSSEAGTALPPAPGA